MSAIQRLRRILLGGLGRLVVFTFVVNLLLLAQPVYMLQVYDRVLASGSVETLVYVSLLAAGALALLGIVDALRGVVAARLALRFEVAAGDDALVAAMRSPRAATGDTQPLRDLQSVRGFVGGRAVLGFLDLPFAPVFVALLWFIHPHLFGLTLGGALVLSILALLNQQATGRLARGAGEQSLGAMAAAQSFVRNAESVRAMGMSGNAIDAWGRAQARALAGQDRIARINAWYSGLSKALRLGLQIAILGLGGWLVLEREITGGMIFAASLIAGRALQPIDQAIAGWQGLVEARRAWERLKAALAAVEARRVPTALPAPAGRLSFHDLVVSPQGGDPRGEPVIRRLSAAIPAGCCTVLIGPSGAGKSTLVRAAVGAVPIRSGAIRVDEADIRNWDEEALGRHVGYLAQDVELLPGTIAQNIARFDAEASDAAIVQAARKAQVHDLIQRLPGGYDTEIGPGAMRLSGGQRQRIGLARAFFGDPRILILDEPNAHLDGEGEAALVAALRIAKAEKVTVLLVTQRRNITDLADAMIVMMEGAVDLMGPRAEVLARLAARAAAESRPAAMPRRLEAAEAAE